MHNLAGGETEEKCTGDTIAALEAKDAALPALLGGRRCDYLALACGHNRQTVALGSGIAHSPGATQGLARQHTGPHGCTLVDVDADGTAECTFLATAAVRWESRSLPVSSNAGIDGLISKMRETIADCEIEGSEKVWLVSWEIGGCRSCDWLEDASFLGALNRSMETLPSHEHIRLVHAVDPLPGLWHQGSPERPLADYLKKLRDAQPLKVGDLEDSLQELAIADDRTRGHIRGLLKGLDYRAVSRRARRHGVRWFAPPAETTP